MESILYRGISTNESTHLQGYHPRLSVFIKKITIHIDVSYVKLGTVIMQEVKPIGFYYRRLLKRK